MMRSAIRFQGGPGRVGNGAALVATGGARTNGRGLHRTRPFRLATARERPPRHLPPAAKPPPIHHQCYICEHRSGPDEIRSRLIRRDRLLDPKNANAYFKLVEARLRPGEFVVLRLGGKNLRLSHAGAAAA